MNQQDSGQGDDKFKGRMLLYSRPELLTVEDHGHLGINVSSQSFDFARSARAVPIAAVEIASAQRNYPVIFSDLENPTLLAVVGLRDESNLFVNKNGEWERDTYIPAYLRCHPYALAAREDDHYAVVIDRAASVITENAELPFFESNKLTDAAQTRVDFCVRFDAQIRETSALCDRLVALSLLSEQEATFKPSDSGDERTISRYVAVDFNKMKELDEDTLKQLHLNGTLAALYAHGFSLDNWIRLLERSVLRRSGD